MTAFRRDGINVFVMSSDYMGRRLHVERSARRRKRRSARRRRRRNNERPRATRFLPTVNSALLKRNPSVAETAFRVTGSGRGGGGDLYAQSARRTCNTQTTRPPAGASDDTHTRASRRLRLRRRRAQRSAKRNVQKTAFSSSL